MQVSSRQKILTVYLILFGLIGPLTFLLGNHGTQEFPQVTNLATLRLLSPKTWGVKLFNPKKEKNLQAKVSFGDKVLITLDTNPEKELGVDRVSARKFKSAAEHFSRALKINQNDPESLIYMNNARAIAAGDSVEIAVVVPIGSNVNVAKEALRGIAQYQHEINQAGGIQGRQLRILIADDEDNPEVARDLAIKLVQNPQILAVIGHESSKPAIAAARIYNQHGVVMLSPSGYARELTAVGDFIFRTTPNSRVIADRLAQHTAQLTQQPQVAICYDSQEPDSRSFRDDFIAALHAEGGQITHTVCDFSASEFNPHAVPAQAIRDGATALLLAPALKNLNQAIGVMKVNQGRLMMLASHSMYTIDTLKKGRVSGRDMTLSVPWEMSVVQNQVYVQNAKSLWKGLGSWRTAMAYDAAKATVQGLMTSSTRQGLQNALANPGFSIQGATGQITFLPTGDRKGQGMLVKILPGQGSGTGFDFVAFRPQAAPSR